MRSFSTNFCLFFLFFAASSCSIHRQISRSAKENILSAPSLLAAHVGITVYEPATNRYWYNYQGDHYFVPASNTKIATCYAAMKYLGDSLIACRYTIADQKNIDSSIKRKYPPTWKQIAIYPNGDPTFLLA